MPRGHSDGVRVPTARPFFFFRRFYKSYYGEDGRNPVLIYREKSRGESLCSIEKLHILAKRKWIDAGENPAVRHEGVPPSNNLIKDGTHRATVFVGPTLKSFSFYFRQIGSGLYGGDIYGDQENYQHYRNTRYCGSSINGRSRIMDECSE